MVSWRCGISLLVFNLISHEWAQRTSEISSWTPGREFPVAGSNLILVNFFETKFSWKGVCLEKQVIRCMPTLISVTEYLLGLLVKSDWFFFHTVDGPMFWRISHPLKDVEKIHWGHASSPCHAICRRDTWCWLSSIWIPLDMLRMTWTCLTSHLELWVCFYIWMIIYISVTTKSLANWPNTSTKRLAKRS